MENVRRVIMHVAKLSIDRSVELTVDVFFFFFLIKTVSIGGQLRMLYPLTLMSGAWRKDYLHCIPGSVVLTDYCKQL